MDINRKALVMTLATAMTVPAEGLRQWAYKDPPGIPSICFGSTKGVKMGDFRTIPECHALLTKEMNEVIDAVDNCRPGLPIPVLAAFSDASYNIGTKIACSDTLSTAARMLRTGDYAGACQQLLRWDKTTIMGTRVALPGLTKRRALNRDVCMTGVA